jgi:hypothetical protein
MASCRLFSWSLPSSCCGGLFYVLFHLFKESAMPRDDGGMVTSGVELPGYRIVRNFGIVRGIVVRSRSIIGNLGAALQTIAG